MDKYGSQAEGQERFESVVKGLVAAAAKKPAPAAVTKK